MRVLKVLLATLIVVVMKTEMRIFNNNEIKSHEALIFGYFKLYFAA
jgi:hypothetical protein